MDFESLQVVVGGNLKDGFGASRVPKADVSVDGSGDDLAVDPALRVHVHHPSLMLAQRHHSAADEEQVFIAKFMCRQ